MIIDPSGKLLTRRKIVSRKDVIANPRVPYLHTRIFWERLLELEYCVCMSKGHCSSRPGAAQG